MKRIIALTITVIILAACTKRGSNSGITILPDVELNNFVRSGVLLTSLIDDYSIIPLETTDESLIGGRSNKVVKKNGNIYVQSINDIVVFDDKGRFRNRLSKAGAGPDEYSRLLDFDIVT